MPEKSQFPLASQSVPKLPPIEQSVQAYPSPDSQSPHAYSRSSPIEATTRCSVPNKVAQKNAKNAHCLKTRSLATCSSLLYEVHPRAYGAGRKRRYERRSLRDTRSLRTMRASGVTSDSSESTNPPYEVRTIVCAISSVSVREFDVLSGVVRKLTGGPIPDR